MTVVNHTIKHGAARSGRWTSEYVAWRGMKARCYMPNFPKFKDYGARGIRICDAWREDFAAFLEHVGPKPSPKHSIERIDNERGYEPGNVRWATPKEQARNRRSSFLVTHAGLTLTVAEWSERTGLPYETLRYRLKYKKWPTERALTAPLHKSTSRRTF